MTYDEEIASTSSKIEARADGVAFWLLVPPVGASVENVESDGDDCDVLPTPSLDRARRPTSTTGTRLSVDGLWEVEDGSCGS
jgi:hypothetical protein